MHTIECKYHKPLIRGKVVGSCLGYNIYRTRSGWYVATLGDTAESSRDECEIITAIQDYVQETNHG